MTVYQLHASGPRAYAGGIGRIVSKRVFTLLSAAQDYEFEFKAACMTDAPGRKSLDTLEAVHTVAYVELEVVD